MEQPKDKRWVAEFFQQVWTQALVTVSGAEEEVSKLVTRLQGAAGWSQDEVKKQVRELSERLNQQRKEIESRVEEAVQQSVARLRVPRREQLAQMNARLDALAKRFEALSK